MKSARTLGGRGRVALFAWTVGATLPAACLPVERPEKGSGSISPAGAARDAGTALMPTAQPPMSADPGDGETLPGNIPVGNQASAAQSAAACADGADSCSALGDAGAGETCPGCLIDGSCFAPDAPEPGNTCRICDPQRDPRGWSSNDEVACDDGLFCTVDDACAAGSCTGAERSCDDGVECNGSSTCNETTDSCSAPVSQCGNNALCDVATDTCVSTCAGCIVGGVCIPDGSEAPGNPCQVCAPELSTTAYSIAAGKSCGAATTTCSGQDTCNAQGQCAPNHLPANSPCGSVNASFCDQADACDGNGNCQQRVAENGTPCNDGAFCSSGDQCQAGQCVATGMQNCGAGRVCNEAADQCQCQGCQVGGTCLAAGASNPANPCQVCNPAANATGFSVAVGAFCGAGANQCSDQDTCNAQGQCVANDRPNGSACTSVPRGACQNAVCVPATLPTGATCTQDNECSSSRCLAWFRDRDGDGFGTADDQRRTCSSQGGTSLPPTGYAANSGDCCDIEGVNAVQSRTIFPGQTQFFDTPQIICSNIADRDYNCSQDIEFLFQDATERGGGTCAFAGCNGVTVWDLSTGVTPPRCGAAGPIQTCTGQSGACTRATAEFTVNLCH